MMTVSFEPQRVCEIFKQMASVRHCSYQEKAIRALIVEMAQKAPDVEVSYYHAEARDPGEQSIVLRRKASPGWENQPSIALQAHLDMVCAPSPEAMPTPLKLKIEQDKQGKSWLKAEGTSLGADNGIGVAAALALIADAEFQCGAMECLFTVQEEVGLFGAQAFKTKHLNSRLLINLDNETLKEIIYGCAGMATSTFTSTPCFKPLNSKNREKLLSVELSITGGKSGHSGMDIHKGRANAIKLLATLLRSLRDQGGIDLSLTALENGQGIFNAIAHQVTAKFLLPIKQEPILNSLCEAQFQRLLKKYKKTDPNLNFSLQRTESIVTALDRVWRDRVINFLQALPHGVISTASNETRVESSVNLAGVRLDLEQFSVISSYRSDEHAAMQAIHGVHQQLGDAFSFAVEQKMLAHPWQPDQQSELLSVAKKVYQSHYGQFSASVVHAGVECGVLVDNAIAAGEEKIDCIAIGPTIVDPHSTSERLALDGLEDFVDCVKKIMTYRF
ncbi:M20/M25/M40 family metallo-hydrolase [Magnetococcales bacterium HHB-1]